MDAKTQRKIHLGLRDPGQGCFHYPVIKIKPLEVDVNVEDEVLLFTSQTAVELMPTMDKECICVGKKTAEAATRKGFSVVAIAEDERQEGVLGLLGNKKYCWPRSTRARDVIEKYCDRNDISLRCIDLYDVVLQRPEPVPSLDDFEEIVFTSPSCVDGFFAVFNELSFDKKVTCIGPVTSVHLEKTRRFFADHAAVRNSV